MQTEYSLRKKYLEGLLSNFRKTAAVHQQFLEYRKDAVEKSAESLSQQIAPLGQVSNILFSIDDLREFAVGDIVKCLGPNYAVYQGRRSPRIPNGDLLMISRVLSIHGKPGQIHQKASISSEFDVPHNAWFLPENDAVDCQLPLFACLEVGLQPCGFLSAYLETPLRFPDEDYYFRNLGGRSVYTKIIDVRGKTIRVNAVLEKTVFSATTIIQDFNFELICDGVSFFKGWSSFGYFSAAVMSNQLGLDDGKSRKPWSVGNASAVKPLPIPIDASQWSEKRQTRFDQISIDRQGGKYQAGYIYCRLPVSKDDWFFACHFYQDPVMPGSLGIEAIVQALNLFVQSEGDEKPTVQIAVDQELEWKYRGQVLMENREIQLEVHIRSFYRSGDGLIHLTGEASLWADAKRIYEIHNLVLVVQR